MAKIKTDLERERQKAEMTTTLRPAVVVRPDVMPQGNKSITPAPTGESERVTHAITRQDSQYGIKSVAAGKISVHSLIMHFLLTIHVQFHG